MFSGRREAIPCAITQQQVVEGRLSFAPLKILFSLHELVVTPEERLIEIEIKLLAQEDLVQSLNDQVYLQQKQIDELKAQCTAMAKRLSDAARDEGGADPYAIEKPPHY